MQHSMSLDLKHDIRYTLSTSEDIDLTYNYPQYAEPAQENKFDIISCQWMYFPVGGLKPEGLWYAFGFGWIDFERAERKSRNISCNPHKSVFQLTVNTTKFIHLSTLHDITVFNREYAVGGDSRVINWERVSRKYSGIEINPFRPVARHLNWYRSFDITSGCIWDLTAITGLKKIK